MKKEDREALLGCVVGLPLLIALIVGGFYLDYLKRAPIRQYEQMQKMRQVPGQQREPERSPQR